MSLMDKALEARAKAYAPYSEFKVGSAIRSSSGKIYVGCNVENASYPEGTCAEAGAIAAMVAAGDREIAEVAVVAGGAEPVSPCGGCRQRLAEFAKGDVPVHMGTLDGAAITRTMAELLPGAFEARHMDS
ncbi:MAG: cytidine deaminase [Roseovarius sp.]|nr:cytidine deaminase [Roseovarius sp.]MCY4292595.1 cytidine deaminase [Roseovarius sp.]